MKQEKIDVLFQIEALEAAPVGCKGPFTVVLVTREGSEPWIRILGADGKFRPNEFNLAGMFEPQMNARQVLQFWGDGPESSTVSEDVVRRAVEAAMERLTRRDGHLEVVWVPNDPRLPF